MLEGLFRMTGQGDYAAMAASLVATLKNLPQEVLTATGLFADGDLDAAEALVRAFLLKHDRDHVEGMRLLARIGIEHKVFDDAGDPARGRSRAGAGLSITRDGEYLPRLWSRASQSTSTPAASSTGCSPKSFRGTGLLGQLYATTAAALGEHERAIGLYRKLLTGTPQDADVHLSIAHAQKTLGRRQEAVDSYRRAAECREDFGDAYWSLANLKTYRFSDAELARLRVAESAPGTLPVDRYHLCFALGKALEDLGDFSESFRYYEKGNALKRAESKYRPDIIETNTRQQIEVCTPEFFADRCGWGARKSPIPFSSSACRAQARRWSSKFSPLTQRSRARRNSPIFSRSWASFAAAIRI